MNENKPPARPETTTIGWLPVQVITAEALPVPPGTPARPRADRPPYVPPSNATTDDAASPAAEDSAEPERHA
jgi:hypothetical protein